MLKPDIIVTLAANLADVEDRCDPVQTPGPSYEEVKRSQASAVVEPVQTLVRKYSAPEQWISSVVLMASFGSAVGRPVLAERVLEAFWDNAIKEGKELARARVRDAKVAAILQLGAPALSASFVAAELHERSRSLGEAAQVLARIDALPGLREKLSAEIRGAIELGRAFAAAEGLDRRAKLEAFMTMAQKLEKKGEPLTPRELQILQAFERLGKDTAFHLGVESAFTSPPPR